MPYKLYKINDVWSFVKDLYGNISYDIIKRIKHPFFWKEIERKDGWVSGYKIFITHSDKPIPHPFNKGEYLKPVWVGCYYDPISGRLVNQYTHGISHYYKIKETFFIKYFSVFNNTEKAGFENIQELYNNVIAAADERQLIVTEKLQNIGIPIDLVEKNKESIHQHNKNTEE